jgi:hypothetical protein
MLSDGEAMDVESEPMVLSKIVNTTELAMDSLRKTTKVARARPALR